MKRFNRRQSNTVALVFERKKAARTDQARAASKL
jgi:hypothetical protein